LILEDVRLSRGGTEILRGVGARFEPGHRYVLLGRSGAGKSSLLRLLNRLDDPDSGTLFLGPHRLDQIPIRATRSGVGQVFQTPRLLPGTVAENLAYPFVVRRRPPPDPSALADALAEVGLNPLWLNRDTSVLSGGERQRLALALALAAGPEILALDEPTSALDPASARAVADLLAIRAETTGLRTIAVCHHRGHAALLGDVGLVLERGRIVDQGPIAEVLDRTDEAAFVASRDEETAS
jgi:ABC-type methionine transport system ATPase subunit